ncbi:MAG: MerR family transcriptional regulator [Eubacteriales bacterium]|nr:MerR family transcriptional regulator [Eubacteriales bacterium]
MFSVCAKKREVTSPEEKQVKEYLTVGELARTFGLDVQTLHFYDSIGLFQPARRDPKTNYRKYRFDQIYQLASIRYLRKMGYTLDDVQKYLDTRSSEDTLNLLNKRSEELQREWAQLIRINNAIRRKIEFVNQRRKDIQLDSIEICRFPERRYIPIGTEEILYLEDPFYFYPTIAFYEGDLKYFGAYLYMPPGRTDLQAGEIGAEGASIIEAGPYLVGYHQGPYETIKQRIAAIRASHPELRLGVRVISFNIIDQFLENNSNNYITEIQIPIEA